MRDLNGIKIITGAELAVVLADDTQLTIDSEHISLNGIVLDDSTSVDGQFTIGAAVTGQLTITILNEDELYSPYNFRDATCQLTLLGVDEIPDDEEEMEEDSIIIGQYNIVDYTYDGSDITLTAYDNLCKFDFPCTETRGETITFPMTLTALVQTAARVCQVTLASQSSPIPNGSYVVAQKPEGWDTMTWHDVVAYCAQLGGVYAKTDKYGRVFFDWYNINAIPEGYDGGTFDTTTTPYSDGDELDGGDFSYDGSEDSADGGTFTYPADMHFIDSPYSLTIDTDDVYITGLKVILEVANNINADENTQDFTTVLYGTDGYVITISGNPFIQTTTQANAIKDFLGAVAVGMWFRPLNATIDDDLSIESGDQAYINGVNGNTYQCFISHVTYTTNAGTVIACDAEANSSSEKTRFTAADKLASHVATIQKRLEGVSSIAGNTNQYFWHTETGADTGAHITEVPQEEWNDPNNPNYHSGGNLLARSNGIAVRDGLTELAQFKADGIDFYDQYSANVVDVDTDGSVYNGEFSYEVSIDSLAPNNPYVVQVDDPYFINFTDSGHLWAYQNDRYADLTWIDLTEDGDYEFYSIDVKIEYSCANRTFTFTNEGESAQTQLRFVIIWESSISASSFSFGRRIGSKGGFSGIIGEGLSAQYDNQVAVGRYNDNQPDTIFEVGGGDNYNERKNLLEVKKQNGDLKISGILTQKPRQVLTVANLSAGTNCGSVVLDYAQLAGNILSIIFQVRPSTNLAAGSYLNITFSGYTPITATGEHIIGYGMSGTGMYACWLTSQTNIRCKFMSSGTWSSSLFVRFSAMFFVN